MSFSITFSVNNSPNNKIYKDLTSVITLQGTLKNSTSILTPTILLDIPVSTTLSTLSTANYAYIESFNNRKYFITDIKTVKNNLLEIDMKCDVLSTYASDIVAQTAIVKKHENKYNLYLNDGTFKVYQNPKIQVKKFPTGFSSSEYVLSIAGG